MNSSQRVTTRSRDHRDMEFIEAVATPSFSVGTTTTTDTENPARPRSTRRAAVRAATRIAQEAGTQRRSTRLATRNNEAARTGVTSDAGGRSRGVGRGAASPVRRNITSSPTRGTKETPIVLDDEETDEMDLKPAAKPVVGGVVVSVSATEKPPADFTCAICLDAPPSMAEVASLSGCTHRFCFDCIDKWAQTENKCPCCKQRFRTIDRVVALPSLPEASTGRRPKRKKADVVNSGRNTRARRGGSAFTVAASGGGPSPARNRHVNSRTVEDRNQQSLSAFPINAAIVEQILASFSSFGGPHRGTGQVTFGTNEDGRPAIRMIRPASGGMVGVMEMFLPEDLAVGGNGGRAAAAASGSGAARGNGASAGGRESSPSRTARVRFSRAPGSSSRRGSSSEGTGGDRSSIPLEIVSSPPLSVGLTASEIAESESSGVTRARGAASARPVSAGSARAASAGSRPGGSRRQGVSSFTSLFASLGGSRSNSSRSRRSAEGADTSPTGGAAGSVSAGDNSISNRMTIRMVARRDRATGNFVRSDNSRNSGGSSASGSGSNDPNEPIVID